MNVAKLSEEQLKSVFPPDVMLRAEGVMGQFYECTIKNGDLHGKIRGNHGEYNVMLKTSQNPIPVCLDEKSQEHGSCKHMAALGLTYIYTPWVFKSEDKIDRTQLDSLDDIQFYVAITPLRELIDELKTKNISLSKLSEITRLPLQQISAVIRDSNNGTPHSLTEPLKLACLYLLDSVKETAKA